MSNFIGNLIARHTTAASYVLPRLRGRFETQAAPAEEAAPGYLPPDLPLQPPSLQTPSPRTAKPDYTPSTAAGTPPQPGNGPLPAATIFPDTPYQSAASPVTRTITPPGKITTLHPENDFQVANEQHPVPADDHPDPIPGTVNNKAPVISAQREPSFAARALYFSVGQPGQNGAPFSLYNGNGAIVPSRRLDHFSPDRSWQRSAYQAAADTTPQQPVIKVTIGRIDVRAVSQPAAAKTGAAPKPAMSLDDFLKKRSGGTS